MPKWNSEGFEISAFDGKFKYCNPKLFYLCRSFLQIHKEAVKSNSDAAGKLWRLEPWHWNFLVDMQQNIVLWCSVGCCHFGTCSCKCSTSAACKASGEVWQSQNCNIKQRVWLSTYRRRSEIVLGTQSHEWLYGVKWRFIPGTILLTFLFKKEKRMPCFCLENWQLEKLCFWAFVSNARIVYPFLMIV